MHPAIAKRLVPSSNNTVVDFKRNYNTKDIIEQIKLTLPLAVEQTKTLANSLRRSNKMDTLKAVFDFLKTIHYKVDPVGVQVVPAPSKVLTDNQTDCKGLSIMTHGILTNLGFEHSIKFAKYKNSDTPNEFTHVYCTVPINYKRGASYITIDAVADQFDYEFPQMNGSLEIKTTMNPINYNNRAQVSGLREWYNNSNLKKKLSEVQNDVKAQLETAKDWIKDTGSAFQDSLKGVWQGVKTVAAAPSRAAYLSLLSMNFRGWATLFNYGRMSTEDLITQGKQPTFIARAQGGWNALNELWYKLGGNRTDLANVVGQGAGKKPLFGSAKVSGVGEPVTLATVLTSAAAIMAVVAPIIQAIRGDGKDVPSEVPSGVTNTSLDPGAGSPSSNNTLMYLGLGALAIFGFTQLKK